MKFPDMHPRIEEALGHPLPPAHSVKGLTNLPQSILQDAATVNERCGSLWAFVYLYNTTDATFSDVKMFCSGQGWTSSVD